MGIVRGLNLALATQPEIKTGADLKGKSVGISDFTGLPHTALLIALKQLGLQKNDITYVKTGGKSLRFQALITKRVAATILDPPFTTMAQEKGFKLITDLTNLNVPYMRVLIAVPEKALLENSGTATAFVEAVSEGIKFYKDTKNKEETIQILAKYMRLSPVEKRQMLEEGIATYLDMTPTKSYPYPKDLQIVLDTIAESNFKAKNVNPASFVDMALVQRLDETGFFGRPGK
jgi:ABC-type nitrate/sulfonate/bicarbonate transport system substrate-binding protein